MKTTRMKFWLALLSLSAITGCGGGGNSVPLPPPDLLPHRDAYAITDVGAVVSFPLGYYGVYGIHGFVALNDQGAVTHNYGNAASYWQNGKDVRIGYIGGSLATAFGLNDSGQLVGTSDTNEQYYSASDLNKANLITVRHAFLWQSGTFTDLGALPLVASTTNPSFTGDRPNSTRQM